MQSTPDGTSFAGSPQPPVSPRAHQRIYSDAQKQLYFNQRELFSAAIRGASPNSALRPTSPRLQPLGSPGPVTPLDLEREEGYLVAGARCGVNDMRPSDELVESLINAEAQRYRTSDTSSRTVAR
jgi:hypothetical protein